MPRAGHPRSPPLPVTHKKTHPLTKNQRMKTSLQIRSLRAAGLALALGLGLAAMAGSAKAAIIFNEINQTITNGQTFNFSFANKSGPVSGYSISYSQEQVYSGIDFFTQQPYSFTDPAHVSLNISVNGYISRYNSETVTSGNSTANLNSFNGVDQKTFTTPTQAVWVAFTYPEGASGFNNNVDGWMQLSFNNQNAVLGAIAYENTGGNITIGDTGNGFYTPVVLQNVASVPEPGTFIPAAVLVAGALLRRRRPRSHRSGRATA